MNATKCKHAQVTVTWHQAHDGRYDAVTKLVTVGDEVGRSASVMCDACGEEVTDRHEMPGELQ